MRRTARYTSDQPPISGFAVIPRSSAAVIVPLTFTEPPVSSGQSGVPMGPLPKLEQKKTMTPPATCSLPKWIWDYKTLTKPE
jgi:hypothetical protein